MFDEFENSEEYIEVCRRAAWACDPNAAKYWDPVARDYIWPSRWPDGVDPDVYVKRELARLSAKFTPAEGSSTSPSVRRFREMLR